MTNPYIGEIRMFAGTFAPIINIGGKKFAWHLCDGTELRISDYTDLYAAIGTTWGGDGRVTFGLPDLRGRVAVGQGVGAGLTLRKLAATGGEATVTLTEAQMGPHTHSFYASTDKAIATFPGDAVPAVFSDVDDQSGLYVEKNAAGAQSETFGPGFLGSGNQGEAITNKMPFLVINFVIALYGAFPARS